jgi:tRNA modification GTPase
MNLTQAEAVADLIAASNDGAVTLALEKMSGTQNKLVAALAEGLRGLAILGEAGIDFADQDLDEVSLTRLQGKLAPLALDLERLQSSYDRGIRVQDGVRAAFVGLPNAGKSSFFNALLGEERSIVSEIAGTTRDVVREVLTLRASGTTLTLRLEDTAGLRATSDRVEQLGIERTRKAAEHADLVLLIVDASSPLGAVQEQWAALGQPTAKTLGILTKCDLLSPAQLRTAEAEVRKLGVSHWVRTSAQTGDGLTPACDAIAAFCAKWLTRAKNEVLLTRLDHHKAVTATLEHLNRARSAPQLELFAADVRQALHSLGPLIGDTLPDDILGQIFSNFCIGK